jgi:hypothetical protein
MLSEIPSLDQLILVIKIFWCLSVLQAPLSLAANVT